MSKVPGKSTVPLYVLSGALFALAGAICYFAFALTAINEDLQTETRALRQDTIPAVLAESNAIRMEAIPLVLEEISRLNRDIGLYLDRADQLVQEANQAGKRASEGAVTGLFTGILRAPVSFVGEVGRVLPGNPQITARDREYLASEMTLLLENDEEGLTRQFEYPSRNLSGSISLVAVEKDRGETRKRTRLRVSKNDQEILDIGLLLTRRPPDGWTVVETIRR